ncbi:biotin/lipoyl-binding protein, partial [Roseomonas sp. GC11]|uniref:biotin/lipoyl-binding protein n=1 Tax=Roseomonas sp. GC11 TaxID=2950546 RepID=UPI00210B7980
MTPLRPALLPTLFLVLLAALPVAPLPAAEPPASPGMGSPGMAELGAGALGVGALGRIEPASRIRRLAAPGGMNVTRLGRLLVEEGQAVAEGQLLAELADAAQKDAQAARAAAALAEAEAR